MLFFFNAPATAQTFTNLYSFTALSSNTNSDGAILYAGLILSSNILYGTAVGGGSSGKGTVFAINTDGAGFTNLHSFTALVSGTNSDGANPYDNLISSSNILYGTTFHGGSAGYGTVFAVNTDGTGFTNLYTFTSRSGSNLTNSDGANPYGALILSGNTLYGTADLGGNSDYGTVFAVNTDGTSFTNLHNFTGGSGGANPYAGLILSSNILYGTTQYGGSAGNGIIFAVGTDGIGFTNLHSFTALSGSSLTNRDGANPIASLILSGNTLYGTASGGGSSGKGTVSAVNTDGTSFTNLHSFTALNNFTNSDGANPDASLILSGDTLYGTAYAGGNPGGGTLFAVHTDSTGITNLHNFAGSDGAGPWAGLILSKNVLYGTAQGGGTSSKGTVFSLSLPLPQLTITISGTNLALTWSVNAAGFVLQSTTNLVSSTGWNTNLPSPALVSGQNVVTNPISGAQMFFRLSQ
jgi:uncharacterized repeat protein (TIGR03803 family)